MVEFRITATNIENVFTALLLFIIYPFKNLLNTWFFPYINIPTLYILEEIQVKQIAVRKSDAMESAICHKGTSKGIRTIITIGEVNGSWSTRRLEARRDFPYCRFPHKERIPRGALPVA